MSYHLRASSFAMKAFAFLLLIALCASVCVSCSSIKEAPVKGYDLSFSETITKFCDIMEQQTGATVSSSFAEGWDSEWILDPPSDLPDGTRCTYELHVDLHTGKESNVVYLFFIYSDSTLYPAGFGMEEDGYQINYSNDTEKGKQQCAEWVSRIYTTVDAGAAH